MAEYISREAVINITAETGAWETQNRVRELSAADVQPVKRGRWQTIMMSEATGWDLSLTGGRDEVCEHICSCCHKCPVYDEEGEPWFSDYCPHCGARMDGDTE